MSAGPVQPLVRPTGTCTPIQLQPHSSASADCTSARPGRRAQVVAQVNEVGDRLAAVATADARKKIRPALNGDQIIATLDLEPGPKVGAAYKHLLSFATNGVEFSEDDAYAELARWATTAP